MFVALMNRLSLGEGEENHGHMSVRREGGGVCLPTGGVTGMIKDPTYPLQTLLVFKNISDHCFSTTDLQEDLLGRTALPVLMIFRDGGFLLVHRGQGGDVGPRRGYVVGLEGRGRASGMCVYNLDLHVEKKINLEEEETWEEKGKGPAMARGVSHLSLSLNEQVS